MDLNFYSELSDGCPQTADTEFLDTQAYGGYSVENKFAEGNDSYLAISGGGHPFLSSATFHTPSLGDEVFELPPISLDPDPTLSISDGVSHFALTDGTDGTDAASSSQSLRSNLVVEANDPSFASTYVNSSSRGLEHLGTISQAGDGALLSSSALELGNSAGLHFNSSSSMTIDVQLGEMGHGLLGSSHLSTINQSELTMGLGGETLEQPLSATPSPAGSLVDEDMDDFKRSVLVDSPMSLSSSVPQLSSNAVSTSSGGLSTLRRGGGKPATLASVTGAAGVKKERKKKDPNEPQKPVSAYALFFRDTQAAIKGQNPNASFGEVSKIVASMWDSLAEEQKQVYKRKTEAAKKEYLKALAAYRDSKLSQPAAEEMKTATRAPSQVLTPAPVVIPSASLEASLPANSLGENAIANICTSNIILDIPQVTAQSRPDANRAFAPGAVVAPGQTITKIIIPKHMLHMGGQVVTMLSGGVRPLQPTLLVSSAPRQPPPLQQMQNAPPPPRLQQMAPAPPPLQAKPREGGPAQGLPMAIAATPPPPLQIKIVPASLRSKDSQPIIVPDDEEVRPAVASPQPAPMVAVQVVSAVDTPASTDEDEVTEVLPSEEDAAETSVCVRGGCNNPAVDSQDWDKEYCSNECVATHCREIFQAWCSIRSQAMES
ncbi:epidermal Langerhans cell protein LCP1-like isoform X2 [Nelusetta ayraudi]|uniref:epidermal Langerhans cell protein LCP1-like isoform X2 n=1 Tax=Nelusetta ayraudi TaxID=303726 RepID=UPI003F7277EE